MATLKGSAQSDTLVGTSGDDFIYGEEELDFLFGQDGNDWIWGGSGGDRMYGGLGDDQLNGDAGNDLIRGQGGNDLIFGGAGDDELQGEAGDDRLFGGDGNDLIFGQSGNDELQGQMGDDRLYGGADELQGEGGNDFLYGGVGNDDLFGQQGNDELRGEGGADRMYGGTGNDTYFVDSVGDIVIERAGEGTDTIHAAFTYTLGANFENLVLTDGGVDGTGNALGNTLTGNNAANTLDGGAGADTLIGGLGDDTYIVDNIGDTVTENAAEGTDTVQSSVTYTLSANVENLVLTGGAAIDGTGNALANTITGNSGDNSLTGGAGNDLFVLADGTGNDIITDFTAGAGTNDTIDMSAFGFMPFSSIIAASTQVGADVVITLDGDDSLTLQNVLIGDIHEDDFVFSPLVELDLADIENGTGIFGFVLNGVAAGDYNGWSASSAGDVNADGLDDVIVSSDGADPNGLNSGAAFVVFGRATDVTGGDGVFELSDIENGDGSLGFVLNGVSAADWTGYSVSSAGDVNGDGFDDVIIGTPDDNPNGLASGSSYVVFGSATDITGGDGVFELSDIENGDGSLGFVLNGISAGDGSGHSVSSAGDINGDGIDDLIIGAPFDDPYGSSSGASFVVFGSAIDITGGDGVFELSDIENGDGSLGFVLNGHVWSGGVAGFSVSSAGDVNGDGLDDLIIGSPWDGPGATYVVFGNATDITGGDGVFELSDIDAGDGSLGYVLNGVSAKDDSGISVSSAGDVNGDGFDDIIIGATGDDPNGVKSGTSFVVFGSATDITGGDGVFELSDIENGDGSLGFVLNGVSAYDASGFSVSSAGDVNGDGLDDLIVGNPGDDPNGTGSGTSFVVFGSATDITGGDGVLELSDIENGDGSLGFVINGVSANDWSGRSVSSAGDVDGDGFDDLIVGAGGDDPNGINSGSSFIIYGGDFTGAVDLLGTSGADVLNGTAGNDIIIGAQGDDTITGGLGDDRLTGALGDDIFVMIAAGGDDTVVNFVAGAGTDDTLDLAAFGFGSTADVLAASTQVGDDVVIALDVGVSVTLSNILLADLHADDFTLV